MNRKILASVLVLLTGLLIFSACTKLDTTTIGDDLIPAVDNVHTFDTVLDVITDNFLFDDSTLISASDPHAIGIIADDPVFGKTEAATYFSVTPAVLSSHPFLNKDSVFAIDSVVLSLPFSSIYGDTNSIEEFEVYEISEFSGFIDSLYPIKATPFDLEPALLGKKTVTFSELNDSLKYVNHSVNGNDSISTVNLLRIKLDTAFGRKFVNFDTTNAYKSDSAFQVEFKGFAVKVNQGASPNASALGYFILNGTVPAEMRVYCRVERNGQTDTIAPVFSYANRAQANLVSHTPAHDYQTYLNNATASDDRVFIQSTPGSYATVKIPGLPGLENSVIHRAELIMERIPSAQDDIYTPPSTLFIDAVTESGDSVFTVRNDFIYTGQGLNYDVNSIGGTFRNDKYIFNLSRYVQSIVTRKQPSYTLRVYAPYYTRLPVQLSDLSLSTPFFFYTPATIAAGRVVLAGGIYPTDQKMRIRIIYSKI